MLCDAVNYGMSESMAKVRLTEDMKPALSKLRNRTPHCPMQTAIERFLNNGEKRETKCQLISKCRENLRSPEKRRIMMISWHGHPNQTPDHGHLHSMDRVRWLVEVHKDLESLHALPLTVQTQRTTVHKVVQSASSLANFSEKGCPWTWIMMFGNY